VVSQRGAVQGLTRRDEILAAATKLFRRNGFERVTIDEIGAAVGVSGPAIYRHFASKDDLLISIFELAVDRLEATAPDPGRVATDPRDALRVAIGSYLDLILPNRRLAASYLSTAVWTSPTPQADRLRRRQLKHVDRVVKMLRAARPELTLSQARTLAHATFGVLNSVAWSGLVVDQRARDVLEAAAMSTLFSGSQLSAASQLAEPKRRSA
jgi:AcrR family transcriptional regulator